MIRELAKLKLVRLGRPIRRDAMQAMADRIREALGTVLVELHLVDHEAPPVGRIDAALLTQALEHDLGGHILAVTDADLVDPDGEELFGFLFGCKDNRNDVAVVSTRRMGADDDGRWLARLLKVGLHEIGHNFGLVHHYDYAPATHGGYCPMTKGDYNRHGERSYLRSVVDARGFHFCDACRRFLRLAHAPDG